MKHWLLGALFAAALAFSPLVADAQQASPQTATGVLNASAATGACTTQACVILTNVPLASQSTCWVETSGTFTATLVVEGSLIGTTWSVGNVTAYGGTTQAASITTAGLFQAPCGPSTRVRISAYTSGTANVVIYATNMTPSGVANVLASVLPPLTGVSGTGTAQAVNQAMVASCAFNSALPTITNGNVGPNQCDTNGRQIVIGTPPLTGLNSTGTAAAVNQMVVAGCNFTTAPATVTTANVVPHACNNKAATIVDQQYYGGTALPTTSGLPATPMWRVNSSGGGCGGVNTLGGAAITRVNAFAGATTSNATVVAGVGSTVIHVCHLSITGTTSTAGQLNVTTGTNANCAAGTATVWQFQVGISAVGTTFSAGDGINSLIDLPTGNFLCVGGATFVGTLNWNFTTAQY